MYSTSSISRAVRTTFRPSFWRCYLSLVTPVLLGTLTAAVLLVGIGNRPISSLDNLFDVAVMSAFFALLLAPRERDRMTIIVSDGMIVRLAKEGDWGWPRMQFAINKVDRERTCKRPSMWQRLFRQRYTYLWSTDGQNIPIDYLAFTPAQVNALFSEIGCEAAQKSK